MNKQELINNGYKYIATQNCNQKTELWAKFTGYLDTISYIYYLPNVDKTIPDTTMTTSLTQCEMLSKLTNGLIGEFFKQGIKIDGKQLWTNEKGDY